MRLFISSSSYIIDNFGHAFSSPFPFSDLPLFTTLLHSALSTFFAASTGACIAVHVTVYVCVHHSVCVLWCVCVCEYLTTFSVETVFARFCSLYLVCCILASVFLCYSAHAVVPHCKQPHCSLKVLKVCLCFSYAWKRNAGHCVTVLSGCLLRTVEPFLVAPWHKLSASKWVRSVGCQEPGWL